MTSTPKNKPNLKIDLSHAEDASEGQSNGMFSPQEKDSRKINLSKIAEMNDD